MKRLLLAAFALLLPAMAASAAPPPPLRAFHRDPVWSPNGKQIAFIANRDDPSSFNQVYVMNADGTSIRRLTSDDQGKAGTAWSPDGKWIAYQAYAYIEVVPAIGGQPRRLTGYGGYAPDWSPRGRKIAFARGDDTKGGSIFAMNPDGTRKQLVAAPRNVYASLGSPTWSPDGQRLAFTSGTAPDSSIQTPYLGVVKQFRGRVARYLVGRSVASADWSPDGRKILVVQDPVVNDRNANYTIAIFDLRKRKLRSLGQRALYWARWSPDGRRIVFARDGGIWTMNADGTGVRELVAP
jgi:Tol biopolymer transport system component